MRIKGNHIYTDKPIKEVFSEASSILYNSVVHTLGANGLNSAIPTQNNFLSIINDGKTILENIASDDPALNLAINTLKESAFATNKNAGDGTTSTVVLQHLLLTSILNYNDAITDKSKEIKSRDILKVRDLLLENLNEYKYDIKSGDDLKKIISVSLGSDDLTDVIYEAFNNLTEYQQPALYKNNSTDKTGNIFVDGVSINPVEINPIILKNITPTNNEPLDIIIITQQVSRIDNSFAKLLQRISNSKRKTILFYTEMMPAVLDQIHYNVQEGALNLITVRLAYPLPRIDEYVDEMSKYFNVTPFTDLYPYQLNYDKPEAIGKATGYIMNKDAIIVKNDNPDYVSELLPSKSSAIEVGFITFSQQEEEFRRIEDAIHSAFNARNSGYTIGGGLTYAMLSSKVPIDYSPISESLKYIYEYLSKSADNQTDYKAYLEQNIFDSYKVTEQVILNAFTVVSQILSIECLLIPYD